MIEDSRDPDVVYVNGCPIFGLQLHEAEALRDRGLEVLEAMAARDHIEHAIVVLRRHRPMFIGRGCFCRRCLRPGRQCRARREAVCVLAAHGVTPPQR